MTPQKQIILHSETTQGNCLQAAVASILDLPIETVPHFVLKDTWWNDMISFAKEAGYRFILDPKPGKYEYVLMCGVAMRGTQHVTIYKNDEPFFDPHPSDLFLITAEYSFTFQRED